MKIIKNFLASVFFLLLTSMPTLASTEAVQIEYFGRDTCQHCIKEKAFLEKLQTEMPELKVVYYDITESDAKELFNQVTTKAELSKTTPLTFIGNTFVQGFRDENSTGKYFRGLLQKSVFQEKHTIQDFLDDKFNPSEYQESGATCAEDGSEECEVTTNPDLVFDFPIIGTIDVSSMSLIGSSVLLGFIDGFNPCAMWVLVMFLTILIQSGSREKMFLVAGTFIFAEAIMYYLILTVWMTTWDFVGLDMIVTKIVGLVAIGGGCFFLWEWKNSDGTCQVTSFEQRKKTQDKIKNIVLKPLNIATFFGILGLAFSVNIIEFACSIGIPQAFTKILDINFLSSLQKHFYIFIYIIFYMLDDFAVFALAIYSFEKIGLVSKYTAIANLIGGLLMLAIGILMIINPALLIF